MGACGLTKQNQKVLHLFFFNLDLESTFVPVSEMETCCFLPTLLVEGRHSLAELWSNLGKDVRVGWRRCQGAKKSSGHNGVCAWGTVKDLAYLVEFVSWAPSMLTKF